MLNLASETDPAWVQGLLPHLDVLLIDHAHCEKKAAGSAIQLMFRYPHIEALLRPLSALAREELEHFDLVLDLLADRGVAFGRLAPSPYAAGLRKAVRTGEPERLVDTLLCSALIEARSCERMKLLAEHLPDSELAAFYGSLLESEARHHALFLQLAEQLVPREVVRHRLAELAVHEAEVLAGVDDTPRMHSGVERCGSVRCSS